MFTPDGRSSASSFAGAAVATGWSELGPQNIGGRTRVLAFDPHDANVVYAGGVSGGLWKSFDHGTTWTATGDALANLAVNSFAIDPVDSKTLYVGTGEGYFREEVRGTALPIRGGGIYRSLDGGTSWTLLSATAGPDFFFVNDLVISPHHRDRLYAATRSGVFRSDDAGSSWSRILDPAVKGGCLDLAMRTDRPGDFLFASCGTFEQATVYRSIDAATLAFEPVLRVQGMGRTSLAIAPSDQSVVYALAASNDPGPRGNYLQGLLGVYRSTQSGAAGSWTPRVTNASSDVVSTLILNNPVGGSTLCGADLSTDPVASGATMGWYVNVIAVDPTDPDVVFAGGVDLFRSDDAGASWRPASYWWDGTTPSYMHADQHAIVFDPGWGVDGDQTLWIGNDGGVFRADNALAPVGILKSPVCDGRASEIAFVNRGHGLGITQFYQGEVFPGGTSWIGGTQDNGTVLGSDTRGAAGWSMIAGGDGGWVAIDPRQSSVFLVSYQYAEFQRTRDGGKTFRPATTGLKDRFLFITPLVMDPIDADRLWTGGSHLWTSIDQGDHWTSASSELDGVVSAISVDPFREDHVVAGDNGGTIVRSDDARNATGSSSWSATHPRDGYVSSIAFSPHDGDLVYATYAGFGGAHVWRSEDGGTRWAPIDGTGDATLPDIPVHVIVPDPSRRGRLILGTDIGVFVSLDDGAHWAYEDGGYPHVITEWLTIANTSDGPALFAFSHGRGVWKARLQEDAHHARGVRR